MARKKGVTPERLRTILQRQEKPRWGADYIPSILATPSEAPSISRAVILSSAKLGRDVHALSEPEKKASLLALYYPKLVELHEQKMLSPTPRPHPLFDFPSEPQFGLPHLRGTLAVAQQLGYLDLHPCVRVPDASNPAGKRWVPFPYMGDLLLYLRGLDGGIYCVNWSIKDSEQDFERPGPSKRPRRLGAADIQDALARHEIEDVYYADAGIPTMKIAGEQIDANVAANLAQLFFYHKTRLDISAQLQSDLLRKFQAGLASDISPMEVILSIRSHSDVAVRDCTTVLYQAVWSRKLRVDLFKPVVIDRPLRPEQRDVLDVYAHWFKGG